MDDLHALSQLPWFATCSNEELSLLAGVFNRQQFPPGSELVKEGYSSFRLYILLEGAVVVKRFFNDEEIVLARLTPPRSIGEISFVDGKPHSATVVAEEQTLTLVAERDAFMDALDRDPSLREKVWRSIARELCERLRNTSNQVQDFFAINRALCENDQFRAFYRTFAF